LTKIESLYTLVPPPAGTRPPTKFRQGGGPLFAKFRYFSITFNTAKRQSKINLQLQYCT